MGARPIKRKIDELLKMPLSKKMLFEDLNNCKVNITMDKDNKFVFTHVDNKSKKALATITKAINEDVVD